MFDLKQFVDDYANLADMQAWADSIIDSRPPDFVIGGDYMHRWFVMPRNGDFYNIYLHRIFRSDDDVPHDHPWDNSSYVLRGSYIERIFDDNGVLVQSSVRHPGAIVHRSAASLHRLEVTGGPVTTLFLTGPKEREWGFRCPGGWVPWQKFTNGVHGDRGSVGAGCGEFA